MFGTTGAPQTRSSKYHILSHSDNRVKKVRGVDVRWLSWESQLHSLPTLTKSHEEDGRGDPIHLLIPSLTHLPGPEGRKEGTSNPSC